MMTSQSQIQEIFPLASMQQFILNTTLYTKSGLSFQQQYSYYLEGNVNPELCRKAWEILVMRYPALRTSIHYEGTSQPFQVVHTSADLPFTFRDLVSIPEEQRDDAVLNWLREDEHIPFNLQRPPLLRIFLHRIKKDLFILTLTLNHMIFDGWSLGVAFRDFATIYAELENGKTPDTTSQPSMRNYVSWFRKRDKSKDIAWWKEHLSDAVMSRLPFMDMPDKLEPVDADQIYHLVISEKETEDLEESAKSMGITLNVLFQGAWALILSRLSPERKALILTLAASRPVEIPGIDQVFGLMLDHIPYNINCQGDQSVSKWLKEIRALQLESLEHQYVSIQEIGKFGKNSNIFPYNSYLVFENMDTGEGKHDDNLFNIRAAYMNSNISFPLTMMVFPSTSLRVAIIYSLKFFTHKKIITFSERLKNTLTVLAHHPNLTLDQISERADLSEANLI